jgi:hypothetical protein
MQQRAKLAIAIRVDEFAGSFTLEVFVVQLVVFVRTHSAKRKNKLSGV